jgi:hypothetical protein
VECSFIARESQVDEYMDINYMVKAQSIINSQAQEKLKSSLFANPVWTAGVGLRKWMSRPHTDSVFDVLDIVGLTP